MLLYDIKRLGGGGLGMHGKDILEGSVQNLVCIIVVIADNRFVSYGHRYVFKKPSILFHVDFLILFF